MFPFFSAANNAFPACIINGTAVSQTFQILYRNEEVSLKNAFNFKVHVIVEAGKVRRKKVTFVCLFRWILSVTKTSKDRSESKTFSFRSLQKLFRNGLESHFITFSAHGAASARRKSGWKLRANIAQRLRVWLSLQKDKKTANKGFLLANCSRGVLEA